MLNGKNVLLGVTGSIAAYKAAELASKLNKLGAIVSTVMTGSAAKFIAPLTLQSITHQPVATDMFQLSSEFSIEHIALAELADVIVVAPATANIIAKLAHGLADDMLSCVVLASKAPVLVAPAMNVNMFNNRVTQENLDKLRSRGFHIISPGSGLLACGDIGVGRLADTEDIIAAIKMVLGKTGDLANRNIVVTAGGTQEPIDPVRIITNRSSGKMGYAVAEAARDRGASVTLVSAPTALTAPYGVKFIPVSTAAQMLDAVLRETKTADALIMAAAVADYRPASFAKSKIKKEPGSDKLVLEMVRNPDILNRVTHKLIKVGFAAESEDMVANARKKLSDKKLDLIVANDITSPDSGFEKDTNRVILIDRNGKEENLPLLPKYEVANKILDRLILFIVESP